MPLIVHSKSTRWYAQEFAKEYDYPVLVDVESVDVTKRADTEVIGIGGGKVIDYAKILAGDTRSIAIPTTAAGAAATSHAVYWDKENNKKIDIQTKKPIIRIVPELVCSIPKEIVTMTSYDALAHSLESYWSKKADQKSRILSKKAFTKIKTQIENDYPDVVELITAGNIAGEAIEQTGTNMIHAISYPLTSYYDIRHGIAVGVLAHPLAEFIECKLEIPKYEISIKKNIDRHLVAREAMKYEKIHDAVKDITEDQVIRLLGSIV